MKQLLELAGNMKLNKPATSYYAVYSLVFTQINRYRKLGAGDKT